MRKPEFLGRTFKIMTLGDGCVGKTSLLVQFVENVFLEGCQSQMTTIGIDLRKKVIHVNGEEVALQIWDTAGQERYHSITAAYYRGTQGVILVYDVTTRSSFSQIERWIKDIRSKSDCTNTAFLLVANKVDLDRVVTTEEGEALAVKHHLTYIETSARTGENVQLAFETVANLCMAMQAPVQQSDFVTVTAPDPKPESLCGGNSC